MTVHASRSHGVAGSRTRATATRSAGKDIVGATKVLVPSEIDRIKKEAVILTDEELRERKKEQEKQLQATRHESQERKRHMMEKELQVRERREQTAMELELEAERRALLTNDDILRNQHLVSMRKINSLALQASGYMACDGLKERQKERANVEAQYDRLHNQIMVRECKNEMQQRKEDEAIAHAKRIEARQMLEQQIAERQKKLIHDEEAKAVEAQKILNTYKQYEAEEKKKVEQRREHVKEMVHEVGKTNDRIREMKEQAKQREKHEEMVAAAYLRKKAHEEEAKLQEQTRIRKAQEVRVAKLRAQQEKAQDKRAMQDEFRAKKAWEEAEMNTRMRAQREKVAKEEMMQSILKDRKRQEEFRTQNNKQQQQLDANLDALTHQRSEAEYQHRHALQEATRARDLAHGDSLRDQIQQNEQRRNKAKLFEQNDSKFVKKKAMKESIIAEKYRKETLEALQKRGAAEEYVRELQRMTINETNA